jgi:hypothetical protein
MENRVFVYILILFTGMSACSRILQIETKTKKPVSDIPLKVKRYTVRYRITISKFDVEVLDGNLNLFKNQALLKIDVEGSMDKEEGENFYFDKFVVIEKVTRIVNKGCDIEIEFIPTFSAKKKKGDKTLYIPEDRKVNFKTRLEHRVYSGSFGQNNLKIRFMDQWKEVTLFQRK